MSTVTIRDYELADTLVTDSPEQLKAMGDPLRKLICDIVLEKATSVTELAVRLDRPKGTVAYHVDILLGAGLIKVVRTRKVRAVEERFYGRTAVTYVLPGSPGSVPFLADVNADADVVRMDALEATGEGADGSWGTFTYRRVRLPHHRVADYSRRLTELALEFVDEPRSGDVEFGMYVALFPTSRHRR